MAIPKNIETEKHICENKECNKEFDRYKFKSVIMRRKTCGTKCARALARSKIYIGLGRAQR